MAYDIMRGAQSVGADYIYLLHSTINYQHRYRLRDHRPWTVHGSAGTRPLSNGRRYYCLVKYYLA